MAGAESPAKRRRAWPIDGGEMGALIRAHDWAATPLGPIATWPQSLKTAVDLVLGCGIAMVVLWGPERIQIYNDGYRALMGNKHPRGLGQPTHDCWPEAEAVNEPIFRSVLAGETLTFVDRLYTLARYGVPADSWFTVSYSPLRDGRGTIRGILVSGFETTEQHLAKSDEAQRDAELRASEARFRTLAEAVPNIVWTSAGTTIDYFNQGWYAYTGRALDSDLNGAWKGLVHPDDAAEVGQRLGESLRLNVPFESEHRLLRHDGMYRWHIARTVRLPTTDRWIGTATDIHDLKMAQEALRTSEERFRLFAANSQDVLWIFNAAQGVVEYVNSAVQRVYGLTQAEVLAEVGCTVAMLHPDDRERAMTGVPRALAGEHVMHEYRIIRPDTGEIRWILDTAFPMPDEGGHVGRVGGVAQDITERKHNEEAVHRSADEFRALANLVPDLLWRNDARGVTTWYNQRWLDYTGQTLAEALAADWLNAIHPDDRAASLAHIRHASRIGVPLLHEQRIRRGDGVYRWFLVRVEPIRAADRQIVQWFGSATDIEDQRREREDLTTRVREATVELHALSQRLLLVQEEERRHLARELHDEIGQALTGLHLQMSAVARTTNGEQSQALAEAQTIVRELTTRVSALSVDLRPAALDTLGLVPALIWYIERFETRTGIAVDLRHQGVDRRFAPAVEITAYRVVQEALTNIARHAGTNAATVHLLAEGGVLTVAIRDNGRGFDVATTPAVGGLGGMRERVHLLGGTLDVETTPGVGTLVNAEIPLTFPQVTEQREEPA